MSGQQMTVSTPATIPLSEVQVKIAQENPRNIVQLTKSALADLSAYPDLADQMHYSIPYKDNRHRRLTFVEGLGIKAAMALRYHWGNCADGARVADDRGDQVIVQGMFFDYERNILTLRDLEVSKFNKGKNAYRLSDEALRKQVGAGQSKAVRNAILASLPVPLKELYFRTVRTLVLMPPKGQKPKSYADRIQDAKAYFERTYGLKTGEAQSLVDRTLEGSPGLSDENLLWYLIGVKNAIREGAVDVNYIFRDARPPQMPREKTPGNDAPPEDSETTLPEGLEPSEPGEPKE